MEIILVLRYYINAVYQRYSITNEKSFYFIVLKYTYAIFQCLLKKNVAKNVKTLKTQKSCRE